MLLVFTITVNFCIWVSQGARPPICHCRKFHLRVDDFGSHPDGSCVQQHTQGSGRIRYINRGHGPSWTLKSCPLIHQIFWQIVEIHCIHTILYYRRYVASGLIVLKLGIGEYRAVAFVASTHLLRRTLDTEAARHVCGWACRRPGTTHKDVLQWPMMFKVLWHIDPHWLI